MGGRREKRFNIRARLFVGSLPNEVDEEWLKDLFKPHTEVNEVFLHKEKGFGFVRCETRASALKARTELDNSIQKGKAIRVKFSTVNSYVKVTNLPPFVSVELLESAFSQFGEIEMCHVVCDEKGIPKGYGFVLFAKRKAADECVQACAAGAFLLTRLPMSVNVQLAPTEDDFDDVYEESLKKTKEYYRDREVPPRFAIPQTFDHELALRWKALDEIEKKQKEELETEMRAARIKLMDEMMKALEEQEEMLRKTEVMRREEEWRKNDELHKLQEMRKMEEMRRQEEHRKLEELAKQEEMKRRQIDWEIEQRERALRGGSNGPLQPPPHMQPPPGGPPPPHHMPFPDQKPPPGFQGDNNGPPTSLSMPPNSMHQGNMPPGPSPHHGGPPMPGGPGLPPPHGAPPGMPPGGPGMPPHHGGPPGMPGPGMPPPHGPPNLLAHGGPGLPPHGMPPHGIPHGHPHGPGGMPPPHGHGGPMHGGMPPHPGMRHEMDRRDQFGPIRPPGGDMRRMPPKFMEREMDKRRRH